MTSAWNFAGESVPLTGVGGTVTLVQGSSFCICERTGDIKPGGPQGLFVRDTRFCSSFLVTFDTEEAEPLAAHPEHPFAATFISRTRPGRQGRPPLLVFRRNLVGRGMRSDIEVRNDAPEPRRVIIEIKLGADMADLFAVKEGRTGFQRLAPATVDGNRVLLGDEHGDRRTSVRLSPEAVISPAGTAWWTADIEPRSAWTGCIEIAPVIGGEELVPRYRCGQDVEVSEPQSGQEDWRDAIATVTTDVPDLTAVVKQSADDLDALRIFDTEHPDSPVLAAGAPWYMTLFGRDSLLTSWMALVLDTDLPLAVAETLARLQGLKVDATTEEQPGRILHEVRFAASQSLALSSGQIYYGTADATPLFVMLVGELWRWGVPLDRIRPLLPAVEAALEWIRTYGDADGDGYVEYERTSEHGLANQGWKDSADGVSFADGRLPEGPIALAEVQAYCYRAWRAAAELAMAIGDERAAAEHGRRAQTLREGFNRDFWLADRATFAIALDGDKRPVDSVTSNAGHCLWAGIADDDKAAGVAASLLSTEMFSGWGVRTLSTAMSRYNAVSYHNGSVWPHDSAICAAGLRRYGYVDGANRIAGALLAAARATENRLPELFSGLSVSDFPLPVAYPTSCSPQAWSSAAPLLLLRAMLGLEPDIPNGTVTMGAALPPGARHLAIRGLPIGGVRVDVEAVDGALSVTGLPAGVEFVTGQP